MIPTAATAQAELHFDWTASRVGRLRREGVRRHGAETGVQDDLSIQVALINALENGQVPSGISLFDKDGIRDYDYAQVGTETLHTAAGEFATIDLPQPQAELAAQHPLLVRARARATCRCRPSSSTRARSNGP